MKLLFIGARQDTVRHGWDQVNRRNQVVLENFFEVTYLPIDENNRLFKLNLGISKEYLEAVNKELIKGYDFIFVCQSPIGHICRYIKKRFPKVKIITFFHNIERHYALQYYKVSGLRALPYYVRVYFYEKMAARYSDFCITLNDRDSQLLYHFYGRYADTIMPTSLEDKFDAKHTIINKDDEIIDYLFVGTAFYPNIEGVQWFIDNVMPNVKGKLYVVGKDMKNEVFTNLSDRVKVFGFVDDLGDIYRRARMVVSPIFHGGGMKTKTAEALMYGKQIVGSKEALEGYSVDPSCIIECNSKEEYIDAINRMDKESNVFNVHARELFEATCSYQSSIKLFKTIL